MEVTLMLAERCGHHDEARALLKEALNDVDLGDQAINETVVRTEEDALEAKCLGSPTIRVDGLDVEYQEREPDETSAGCRYYNTPAGWKPLPEKGMIIRALEKAKERAAAQ